MAPDRGSPAQTFASSTGLTEARLSEATSNLMIPTPSDPTNEQVIAPHLSHDPENNARVEPFKFGQRYLESDNDVFEYNAWDHVQPDDEHLAYSKAQYAAQKASPVSDFDRDRFNRQPEKWWDLFYKQKTSTFFKDRKWLVQEFPVLKQLTQEGAGKKRLLEVGAGAGNTAFPVMRMNENPELEVIAVDFSKKAVETMRSAETSQDIKGSMRADVWDVASDTLPDGVQEGSVDVVVMIFVFSALNPTQWLSATRNIWRVLKPEGEVLFRDYGRGDLAQVRFKAGRWMGENFYVRGDGTRVYFFDKDELAQIWNGSYFERGGIADAPRFEIVDLDEDRRLIVNRQRRIKMYRCWMQARFCKPRGE